MSGKNKKLSNEIMDWLDLHGLTAEQLARTAGIHCSLVVSAINGATISVVAEEMIKQIIGD